MQENLFINQSAMQMLMAQNIARLKDKRSQKRQAHLLCESLKQSIMARSKNGR